MLKWGQRSKSGRGIRGGRGQRVEKVEEEERSESERGQKEGIEDGLAQGSQNDRNRNRGNDKSDIIYYSD
jgi:hypothetical protein